jgi:predicted small lipoprotein YifL
MIRAYAAGSLLRGLAGALLGLLLASCGLKGELYLPEPEQAAPTGAAVQEPEEDERTTSPPQATPGQP